MLDAKGEVIRAIDAVVIDDQLGTLGADLVDEAGSVGPFHAREDSAAWAAGQALAGGLFCRTNALPLR